MRFDKKLLKNIGYLLLLLAIAPFAMEFLLIAEFAGLEFAVTFMLFYFRQLIEEWAFRWWRFRRHLTEQFDTLLALFLFQPRTYGVTATASCVVVVLTGTTFLACAVWLPAMLMSSGYG